MDHIDGATIRWLVGGLCTAVVALLVATWNTARRSKDAEAAIADAAKLRDDLSNLKLFIFGDKQRCVKAFTDDVEEARESALYGARVARLLFRAFRVPTGANDDEVVQTVRDAVRASEVCDTGSWPVVNVPQQRRALEKLPTRRVPALKPPIRREEDE